MASTTARSASGSSSASRDCCSCWRRSSNRSRSAGCASVPWRFRPWYSRWGLDLGAVVFLGQGRRLVGLPHAIGGAGFTALVVAVAIDSGTLAVAAVLVLGGGLLFLVYEVHRSRRGG